MYFIGFVVFIVASGFAYWIVSNLSVAQFRRLTLCVWLFVFAYGTVTVWPWLAAGRTALLTTESAHLGLVLLYGVCIALIPSGLMRPFAEHRDAVPLTIVGTLAFPFACQFAFEAFGDPFHRVRGGIGRATDLLFLSPFEMGGGVAKGLVTHRFRVHYLILFAITMAAPLLHNRRHQAESEWARRSVQAGLLMRSKEPATREARRRF